MLKYYLRFLTGDRNEVISNNINQNEKYLTCIILFCFIFISFQVTLLVAAGADETALDNSGNTPAMMSTKDEL